MKAQKSGCKPNLVPTGVHSVADYHNQKSQVAVYRCLLRPIKSKRDPKHADYKGILNIANGHARIFVWAHTDGSLGFRMQKIDPSKLKRGAK